MPKKTAKLLNKARKKEEEEKNPYKRIDKPWAIFMVVVALFYEFCEFLVKFLDYVLPGLGTFFAYCIDIVALMHFWLWFKLKGVNLGNPKALFRFWIFQIGEFINIPIPGSGFGLLTAGVVLTIGMTWTEDGTDIKIPKKPGKRRGRS